MKLISNHCIWRSEHHSAFTDLIYFKNKFWCCFREGSSHVDDKPATIRIIKSSDGKSWQQAALIEKAQYDLRDPKFSIHPNGDLYLLFAAVSKNDQISGMQSMSCISTDGLNWSKPVIILKDKWLWQLTWVKKQAFGISYQPTPEKFISEFWHSEDGGGFNKVQTFAMDTHPSEATIRAGSHNNLIALLRTHGNAWLGECKLNALDDWSWQQLPQHLGGPNFLIDSQNKLIACGRMINSENKPFGKTVVSMIDNYIFIPLIELPSGGDNSYPGMVFQNGYLWISYYSSHEQGTAIYLAQILQQN